MIKTVVYETDIDRITILVSHLPEAAVDQLTKQGGGRWASSYSTGTDGNSQYVRFCRFTKS